MMEDEVRDVAASRSPKPILSNEAVGYLAVMTAALMWASSGTAGKALFESGVTPADLVQIRVTLASLILAGVFGLFARHLFRIRLKDLLWFPLLGGVLLASVQLTYFYAISKIQVVAAILLQYLSPVPAAVFSVLFWGERLTAAKAAALTLALGGCYLVVGGYNLELLGMNRAGVLAGLASAVTYAAYALLGERVMQRYPPWTVVFYALVFAALSWHLIHPPFKYLQADYSVVQWLLILHVAVIGTVLPFGLYFVGVNYIRSTRAMITATLEPISAGFMAFVLLGETLEPLQILGSVLVIAAIVLLQLHQERSRMTPHHLRTSREAEDRAGNVQLSGD